MNEQELREKLYEIHQRISEIGNRVIKQDMWLSKIQRRLDSNNIHEK